MSPSLRFKGLLLDLDGTLYTGDTLLPGVAATLGRLRQREVGIRYLTNTTSKPHAAIVAHLARLGLEVDPGHVYTPPLVAREHLLRAGCRRCHFLLRPEVAADFAGIEAVDSQPDAVVLGDLGELFTDELLDRAFRFILDGAAFYTLTRNRCYQAADGLRLDVGAYAAALEFGTRREALLLGKPAPHFFTTALAGLGLRPEDVIMVGDDLEGDVGGAQAAGLRGVLVRTGKFRPSNLHGSPVRPDAILDSFADLA